MHISEVSFVVTDKFSVRVAKITSTIGAHCETKLDGLIDSGNLSVGGYLPLTRKDSITHMYGLVVHVKEGPPLQIFTYVFEWLYFTQCVSSFSSINHLLCCQAEFLPLFHLT